MAARMNYPNEQLVLPLVREFNVVQGFTYTAADIFTIPFEDLFLLYLSSPIKEPIINRHSAYDVHNTTNTPSSSRVNLSNTGSVLELIPTRTSEAPVPTYFTMFPDTNAFFQRYALGGLTMGDLRAIRNKYDTSPNNGDVSPLRAKLFYAVFSHHEKAFSEAYLESYLFRTAIDPIAVLLDYMLKKNNEGLTAAHVERAHGNTVSQLRTHSAKETKDTKPEKSTPFNKVQELVSAQMSLKTFGRRAVGDVIHYVGLTDAISQDTLKLDPMIIKTIVEVKERILDQNNLAHFAESYHHVVLGNLYLEPTHRCGLEKVFYKLIRQCFDTGCYRGIICDQSSIMFIQLSVDASPENHGAIRDLFLKVDIMGPFEIHSTANLTRCMILAFFLPGAEEDKSPQNGLIQGPLKMLHIGNPGDRTADDNQSMFEDSTGAQNQGTSTVGQQPFDTRGSQSHAAHTDIPQDADDSKDDEQDSSRSSEGSSSQSNIAHNPLTGSTSAPPSGQQVEPREVSTEINFTGSIPEMIERLFTTHEIPLKTMEKELISTGPADVFFIDVSILDYLGDYTLMSKEKAVEEGLTTSRTSQTSHDSKQFLIAKIMSPEAWSDVFALEFESASGGQLDPHKYCYDNIVQELKRMARVHRECSQRRLRPIVPQIIGFGKLQDPDDLYDQGCFIITGYAGQTLSYQEANSLDQEIKNQTIRNFRTLHKSHIIHNDIRLPNIAFGDVDMWPTVLDLGNSRDFNDIVGSPYLEALLEMDKVRVVLGLEPTFDY